MHSAHIWSTGIIVCVMHDCMHGCNTNSKGTIPQNNHVLLSFTNLVAAIICKCRCMFSIICIPVHTCRHPDPVQRPGFIDIQIFLQQPDFILLKWSNEDMKIYSENARSIGATYHGSETLYRDLQNIYA